MGDLGDLTEFMKDGNISDLDWLDVNEQDYRELDTLPKQNLDVVPDLQALWNHEDEPSTKFVPNTGKPQTMAEVGGEDFTPEDITKRARLAIMQSTDPARIKHALTSRFSQDALQRAKGALAKVFAERGLLGRLYINAADFSKCNRGAKGASEFVRRFASEAQFVVAKAVCKDCQYRQVLADGNSRCSIFHKQIEIEVPYTEELANEVEKAQRAKGKVIQAALKPKDKKVIDAFYEKKSLEGSLVSTDGKKLIKNGMGGGTFAEWKGSKIVLDPSRPQVKNDEGIIRYMKKSIPKNSLASHPNLKSAKARIRWAMLAPTPDAEGFSGRSQAPPKEAAPINTEQELSNVSEHAELQKEAAQKKLAAQKARPIVAMIRRELLKGRGEAELAQALRLAFDKRDLWATRSEWAPVFREAGLYGTVYVTQDSFDDCRIGADFLARHSSKVRAIVASEKCEACIFSKIGRCLMYGRKLIQTTDEVMTPETVRLVLDEQKLAGKLSPGAEQCQWGKTPRESLKAIHKATSGPQPAFSSSLRGNIEQAFHGGGTRLVQTGQITRRDILKAAAQYMNEGLYGEDLLTVLKSRFEVRDLVAAQKELQPVIAEQGLQGIKFVDPTVYDDYGKGCKEAARKHRSKAAIQYLKIGKKCESCVHQTRPGFCSVISKRLVVEPPYVDKLAEQRAVLASGNSTEVSYESLMNNGLSMMQEYQLQQSDGNIVLDTPTVMDANVEFGVQDIKL
jgi:hypothetical protein